MKIASKKGYMEMVESYFLETLKSVLGSSKSHYLLLVFYLMLTFPNFTSQLMSTCLVSLSILLSWILIFSRRSSTFGLEEEVVLGYGIVTRISDLNVVGFDEVEIGVTGRIDLFWLLFCCFCGFRPYFLVFSYLSLAGCYWNSFNSHLKPPSYSSHRLKVVGAKHQILAVFHLVYRICGENRFCTTYNKPVKWNWEPTLM